MSCEKCNNCDCATKDGYVLLAPRGPTFTFVVSNGRLVREIVTYCKHYATCRYSNKCYTITIPDRSSSVTDEQDEEVKFALDR